MIDFKAGLANGPATSGAVQMDEVQDLYKALTAGYGTDVSTLTGGAALRIQSLDKTLMSTIQDNDHFVLFNKLAKSDATATVDEWTEQNSVGGFLGSATNSETGVIAGQQGNYARRVGQVKYLMTRREVSFVQSLQNTITDSEAVEQMNGALELLTTAEYLCFEGNSAVNPNEFDGIFSQIASYNNGDHVIDLRGQPFASINPVNNAQAKVSGYGNFGVSTDLFFCPLVQADFDNGIDPAFRVSIDGTGKDLVLGAPVSAIRTSKGNIKTNSDVFIRDETLKMPFEVMYPSVAAANLYTPSGVTATAVTGQASSLFGAAQAGQYVYYVTGINSNGQSTGVKSSAVTVAAGGGVQIVIQRSPGATETGYVIYRNQLNGQSNVTRTDGSPLVSDFREMHRIPASGGATTTFVDLNAYLPGTTKAYQLNMKPGMKAITWRKYLPMVKFPLYPTVSATIPWAQLMFGYLRIAKRAHHVVFRNIVPSGAMWKPYPGPSDLT